MDPFSGVTLLVPVRDRQQLQKTGQKLLQIVQDLSSQPNGTNNLQIQVSRVNGERLISVKFGDQEESRSLSWCLTKDLLVISPSRDNVRAQVVRTQGARSLANVPSVESVFKSGGAPVLVGYQDTPKVFDRVYPSLESFAGVFGQLLRSLGGNPKATMLPPADAIRKHLSPAIAAVRWTPAGLESFGEQTLPGLNAGIAGPVVLGILVRGSQMAGSMAARDASADHLRRLAAAILNYQKTHNKFPSIAICDPQGRPLLSCAWKCSHPSDRMRFTSSSIVMSHGTATTIARSLAKCRKSLRTLPVDRARGGPITWRSWARTRSSARKTRPVPQFPLLARGKTATSPSCSSKPMTALR